MEEKEKQHFLISFCIYFVMAGMVIKSIRNIFLKFLKLLRLNKLNQPIADVATLDAF